jgi:lipoyl(octanoyl) transferase
MSDLPKVEWQDLGLVDYQEAWKLQESLFQRTIQQKISARSGLEFQTTRNYLLFCEHPHVYTLGKSGAQENLLLDSSELDAVNARFYKINRGGDITYHGPGQLVMYPVFDLDYFFTDIHKYMRCLEEAVILTLRDFGIEAGREDGLTGVWIEPQSKNSRKICAMGVKSSRWVTMHGIGFNVNTDLHYFSHIIPCGIEDKAVTSLQKEMGNALDMANVRRILLDKMSHVFQFTYDEMSNERIN